MPQTGPVMIGYPAAPEIDAMVASAAAGDADVDVTADDGVRHQLWVISDEADHHGADARDGRTARRVHCRWAPSLGGGGARRPIPRREYGLARLFPRRAVSAPRNDDPRLQPPHPGFERPHAGGASCRTGQTLYGGAVRPAGAPDRLGGLQHVSRRPLVPADASVRPGAEKRSDRPVADHAARAPCDRAAVRHHRSAHRQAHRLRRRRAAG